MAKAKKAIPAGVAARLRRRLLDWYRKNRRDLPWRRRPDPYRVWISEIMLQQTRVEAVLPYYRRFLKKFPGVRALARAPLEDVLTAWAGLGYYRRARSLHLAAGEIMAKYGGRFPRDAEAIGKLPGIGPYTSGAIRSIALGQRAAVVDGNVIRVLSRLFLLRGDLTRTRAQKNLWALAAELVPPRNPGDFNQGLMELGAMVCTPRNPDCANCPLEKMCRARAEGSQAALPELKKTPRTRDVDLDYLCLQRREREFYLVQRTRSPLEGMWEFPSRGTMKTEAVPRLAGKASHAIMNQKITAWFYEAKPLRPRGGRWVKLQEMNQIPLTTVTRKGLKILGMHP